MFVHPIHSSNDKNNCQKKVKIIIHTDEDEHVLTILFYSYMRKPHKCYDQFKEKVKRHKFMWRKEIDLQMDTMGREVHQIKT